MLLLLDLLFFGLNRVEIRGRNWIPRRGERNVLMLCNHISALDPLLIGASAMPRWSPVWWRAAAKEELFQTPLSRWAVRSIGAVPVARGRHDADSIRRIAGAIPDSVLVLFPEGTWSETGALLPGRTGVGRVIYEARPGKILPVAIQGTDRILPRGRIWPRAGRAARIAYGAPLDLTRFYAAPAGPETYRAIVDAAMAAIGRLYAEL